MFLFGEVSEGYLGSPFSTELQMGSQVSWPCPFTLLYLSPLVLI